jgi:hypothetical protein
MISDITIRRALNRIALLKFFPSGNSEGLAAVGEMFVELYSTDAEVERAVSNLLHDSYMAEWPGAGAFFDVLKRAVYPHGMCKYDGRWIPSPANGPKYDIVGPDGECHWHDGRFEVYPRKPWRKAGTLAGDGEGGMQDIHPDATEGTTGTLRELPGRSHETQQHNER